MDTTEAAKNALECVLEAKKGEEIVVFCDDEKMDICKPFVAGALKLGLKVRLTKLKTDANSFRKHVPSEVVRVLKEQRPDIYVNLLRGTREETSFRIELTKMETKDHKTRLAHCPGITLDMLTDGALAMTASDHKRMQYFAGDLIRKLNRAIEVEIATPAGTNLSMKVDGRPFFTDTLIDWKTLKWMNMPTGEVMVAPVENSLKGELVCDMAIGGIGPIKTPLGIAVKNGEVQNVVSTDKKLSERVRESLQIDDQASTVGEFAFGINPKARFVEEFLESEKILGTVHIAFGDNSNMPGGKNLSKSHIDLLMSRPTVRILNDDDAIIDVLVNGTFRLSQMPQG